MANRGRSSRSEASRLRRVASGLRRLDQPERIDIDLLEAELYGRPSGGTDTDGAAPGDEAASNMGAQVDLDDAPDARHLDSDVDADSGQLDVGPDSVAERRGRGRSGTAALKRRASREAAAPAAAGVAQSGPVVLALGLFAAIAAQISGAQPTGTAIADAVLTGAFAALVTVAASRAGTWSLLALSGAAVLLAGPTWFLIPAAAAVWIAATRSSVPANHRIMGAISGGLAIVSALNGGPAFFFGLPSLVVGGLSLWVLGSAWRRSRDRERNLAKQILIPLGIGATIIAIATAVGGALAGLSLVEGERNARAGLDGVENAEADSARSSLASAKSNFSDAASTAQAWWVRPGRLLPVVSQHLQVVESAALAGRDTAGAAEELLATYDAMNATGGRIDVDRLATLQTPLADATRAVGSSARRLETANNGWIVAPVQSRTTDLLDELVAAEDTLTLGESVLAVAPGLLGADGPRRYFVIFGQPGEARELGGFMGNWGELTVDRGSFNFPRNGRTIDLLPLNENSPDVAPAEPYEFTFRPPATVGAYYEPNRNVQDITGHPDFPTVARMINDIYPQAGGAPIDGALYVDPFSLQALLSITGPVVVGDGSLTLDASTAGMFLTREQYRGLDQRDERVDLLAEAFVLTFERLTSSDLPAPQSLIDTLGPMVESGRLQFTSFDQSEAAVLTELGLNGGLNPINGTDFLSVSSANAANNKIDSFLQRRVTYNPTFDPATGQVTAKLIVELENSAPTVGFSEEVLGEGGRAGVSRQLLTIRTPLEATETRLDGAPLDSPADRRQEFGLQSFGLFVTLQPGQTRTVEMDLSGTLVPSDTYRVRLDNQPLVNFDALFVNLAAAPGWTVADAPGLSGEPNLWFKDFDLTGRLTAN